MERCRWREGWGGGEDEDRGDGKEGKCAGVGETGGLGKLERMIVRLEEMYMTAGEAERVLVLVLPLIRSLEWNDRDDLTGWSTSSLGRRLRESMERRR